MRSAVFFFCRPSMWILVAGLLLPTLGYAQHDHDHHADAPTAPVRKPRVFLDKSPRIVAYQLKRLDNQRLLLVDRETTDVKYVPVYQAILLRAGMSPQYRHESLAALVRLRDSTPTQEVLSALGELKDATRQNQRTARELAGLLLSAPAGELAGAVPAFMAATSDNAPLVRQVAYAGLVAAGKSPDAFAQAESHGHIAELLASIGTVPQAAARNATRDRLIALLADDQDAAVRMAAILALPTLTRGQADTFTRLAPLVENKELWAPAVRALLSVPNESRDAATAQAVVRALVQKAEQTPASARTDDDFLSAMQLADQLLARIPPDQARTLRARLRETTVRVVVVHTVEEEMRYDLPYFAVEAGRPVQIVLKNEDLMPHNFVLVRNGTLQQVAEEGLAIGPQGHAGKPYVPDSEDVLQATEMVAPAKQSRLTFTAPSTPGDYPYVCTFPRHWMRMYGVMVVVEDLDAWLQNPVAPADPLGSNRPLVKNWKVDDLQDKLSTGLEGRNIQLGEQLFTEATCAQCHRVGGQGGNVGPELTDVFARWKQDPRAVLQEILDPSHRIDPKYAVHLVVTVDGNTLSGIVAQEDKQSVSLLTNPESKDLTVVPRDEIEELIKTSTSMMPKGLLDRFTEDEIFEILAFLKSLNASDKADAN